jgi:hypothetical protein
MIRSLHIVEVWERIIVYADLYTCLLHVPCCQEKHMDYLFPSVHTHTHTPQSQGGHKQMCLLYRKALI